MEVIYSSGAYFKSFAILSNIPFNAPGEDDRGGVAEFRAR